jgi:hypothetical protein
MINMLPFSMTRDINGYNGFGVTFSSSQWQVLLSTSVISSLTVPTTSEPTYKNVMAIFSFTPGASVWVSVNGTPTIPASGTFAQCESELNPAGRLVMPGDVLSFITSDIADQVGVTFYATT